MVSLTLIRWIVIYPVVALLIQFITIRFIWCIAPNNLVSVAQKEENAIHQINLYPLDNETGFPNTYSDLSGGSAIDTTFEWLLSVERWEQLN